MRLVIIIRDLRHWPTGGYLQSCMKKMKNKLQYLSATILCITAVSSCALFKDSASSKEPAIDIVCNMKVDKSKSFTAKYNHKLYYFDSYTCKESFKMNPEKFIKNQCSPAK